MDYSRVVLQPCILVIVFIFERLSLAKPRLGGFGPQQARYIKKGVNHTKSRAVLDVKFSMALFPATSEIEKVDWCHFIVSFENPMFEFHVC